MKKFISILTALTFAAALTVGSSAALLGDANDDGKINSADALCVLQYSVGMKVKTSTKPMPMQTVTGKSTHPMRLKY